ncbi:hypothetical protein ABZ611_23285 [Streptomyces sp. NPDC007861]|uniref:hypothetical protein n=1 Tax=Streptomyces sp. NPDC007861 TaxID=3154893 RepID=UPI00340168D1
MKKTYYCSGIARSSFRQVVPCRYKVPGGWAVARYGKDVRHLDGWSAYSKSPKANRAYVMPGGHFQISKGKGVKYAAAAGPFGLTIGTSITYDTDHKQKVVAGRQAGQHGIWGKNGPVSGNPGVLYSW